MTTRINADLFRAFPRLDPREAKPCTVMVRGEAIRFYYLPGEVGKCPICLGHLVSVFFFLYRYSGVIGGID